MSKNILPPGRIHTCDSVFRALALNGLKLGKGRTGARSRKASINRQPDEHGLVSILFVSFWVLFSLYVVMYSDCEGLSRLQIRANFDPSFDVSKGP